MPCSAYHSRGWTYVESRLSSTLEETLGQRWPLVGHLVLLGEDDDLSVMAGVAQLHHRPGRGQAATDDDDRRAHRGRRVE